MIAQIEQQDHKCICIDYDVNIYPNPTTGIVNFDSEDDVLVALIAGAINNFEKINVTDNSIDISNFPSGMYMLKLKMASGNIHFEKIILVK